MKLNKTYLLTALGVLGSPLFATNANADLFKCVACTNKPANSSYTTAGNGGNNCSWSCNSGYTQRGNNCCASAPANATLNANDCGWSCNSGYSKNTSGTGCEKNCDAGYTKNGSLCCANKPANSSYSSTTSCDWSCNSGYSKGNKDPLSSTAEFNYCCKDSYLPAGGCYGGCSIVNEFYYGSGCAHLNDLTSEGCFYGCKSYEGYHMRESTVNGKKVYSCVLIDDSSSSSSSSDGGGWAQGRACPGQCDGVYAGCTCPTGTSCYNGYCQSR